MLQQEIVSTIVQLSQDSKLTFTSRAAVIAEGLSKISTSQLLIHLAHAGVIPECFDHDSTEEKLFAKYCDALLARSLTELGMNSTVILERADAADVVATHGKYKIVGDAKAFRLSRTAKNQKDFKVEALNTWRKGADYSCLVCPLYQYPSSDSQIYDQATRYNVTLLSYAHISYLIKQKISNDGLLAILWKSSATCKSGKDARKYWNCINTCISTITKDSSGGLQKELNSAMTHLPDLAEEQIAFWKAKIEEVKGMTREAAIAEVIRALKINEKILVIRGLARSATNVLEAAPAGKSKPR